MALPQNPIGEFIQARGLTYQQKQEAKQRLIDRNAKTCSVMDDFEFCREIKDALPDCVVVFRASDFEPAPGAKAVSQLQTFLSGIQSQDKRIVIMVNCEQGFNQDRANMWADMIVAAAALGWKLCVGNVSSGSVQCGQRSGVNVYPNEWLLWGERLLKTIIQYGAYLGVHEYSLAFPWSVSNDSWGDPLVEITSIDWSRSQWQIGRNIQGLQAACKSLNLDFSKLAIIITENLIDNLADAEAHYHFKSDGWHTIKGKWQTWYPNRHVEDTLADFHIWAWEKVYAAFPNVVGTHSYCYGDASGDKHQWEYYRTDNAPRYQERMAKYRPAGTVVVPPPPPPPPPPKQPDGIWFTLDELDTIVDAMLDAVHKLTAKIDPP